jgi:hypothetical protein
MAFPYPIGAISERFPTADRPHSSEVCVPPNLSGLCAPERTYEPWVVQESAPRFPGDIR